VNGVRMQARAIRVDVLRRGDAAVQLLGTCELPRLSADIIEVLHCGGETDVARGTLRPPEAHRFAILRSTEAEGERLALMPEGDARPEVLPAWQPAEDATGPTGHSTAAVGAATQRSA
jgi:hypothetical protein